MQYRNPVGRRTVLKGLGATAVGSAVFAGATAADNRRNDSFAWADEELYEMLDSEPPAVQDKEPGSVDDEGAHESHRPLWLVGDMSRYSKADQLDGTGHSPHPNPADLPVDHVVPLAESDGGGEFTAQWHVTLFVRESNIDSDGNWTGTLTNLPIGDGKGNPAISAERIRNANGRATLPLFNPETGEPVVFTCPIRPHQHH